MKLGYIQIFKFSPIVMRNTNHYAKMDCNLKITLIAITLASIDTDVTREDSGWGYNFST